MKKEMARVVRDSANAKLDYYIPREEAEALFRVGKLAQVYIYKDEVCYCPARSGK